MIEIFAIWENQDKNGNTYFSGMLGKAQVMIFKNQHKKADNHPDYIVYLCEKKQKDKPAPDPGKSNTEQPASSGRTLPSY